MPEKKARNAVPGVSAGRGFLISAKIILSFDEVRIELLFTRVSSCL